MRSLRLKQLFLIGQWLSSDHDHVCDFNFNTSRLVDGYQKPVHLNIADDVINTKMCGRRYLVTAIVMALIKRGDFKENESQLIHPDSDNLTYWEHGDDVYEILSKILDSDEAEKLLSTTEPWTTDDPSTTINVGLNTSHELNKASNYELLNKSFTLVPEKTISKSDENEPRKTHVKWKTISVNGKPEYTLIKFYQSHGPSYEITIPGDLPAPRNHVIEWIRSYGSIYSKREIPYVGENGEVPAKLLPDICGTKFEPKLFGGRATPIEENPWQVAILWRRDRTHLCGGAIISKRHALSAAHCFRKKGVSAEKLILHVGDFDKEVEEKEEKDYKIERVILHEKYNHSTHLNDIALLTTEEPITFSSRIYPICVPGYKQLYTPGLKCIISGWGQVESQEIPLRYLRSGEVTIVSRDACRQKASFTHDIPLEIFCAEDPTRKGIDTCLGDSGGPLSCWNNGSYYLYGITSFGSYPCGQNVPSFYTTVAYYRNWIMEHISQ